MRAGMAVALAAAMALVGCKALGFTEETSKDWSTYGTKPGAEFFPDPAKKDLKIVATKFELDPKASPPVAKITLRNDAADYDLFSADVEFGYPAPPDSFAPYVPDFTTLDVAGFLKGKEESVAVPAPAGHAQAPVFARLIVATGSDVRMTVARESSVTGLRPGTMLLGNRVEVVKIDGDLTPPEGQKPTLRFVLENVGDKEVGNLRYMVQFYKDGKLMDLGRRFYTLKPVGKALGKKGETVEIDVAGLEGAGSLAGAKPVLRVVAQ